MLTEVWFEADWWRLGVFPHICVPGVELRTETAGQEHSSPVPELRG